jgi:hypothetical protein
MLSPPQKGVVTTLALAIVACARSPRAETEPLPEYVVVRSCAVSVAAGEGFVTSGGGPGGAYVASSSLPGDSVSWVESLVLRVRVYSDSVLPDAIVRRVQLNGRRYYPLSSAGRRIQDRVNEECRVARSAAPQSSLLKVQ